MSQPVPGPSAIPAAWVTQLTGDKPHSPRTVAPVDVAEATAWFARLPKGRICRQAKDVKLHWVKRIEAAGREGGAHDAALGAVWALLRDGRDGHRGTAKAMESVRDTFFMVVTDPSRKGQTRSESEVSAEWARMIRDAIPKIMAEAGLAEDAPDPCTVTEKEEAQETQYALSYELTDVGNAKRLVSRHGTDIRFIRQTGQWIVCSHPGNIWAEDPNNTKIMSLAKETVAAMEIEEQAYQNGDDEESNKPLQAFRKFRRSSASLSKLKAMIALAESEASVPTDLDAIQPKRNVITCLNGTIELRNDGAVFRDTERDDYSFMVAPTRYDPDAISGKWLDFLYTAIPDEKTLHWFQAAMGYSLFGGNPERLLFVVKGPTASGKTALSIAIQRVLGKYAGSFNLTMFREGQEEKARPDLVRVLPRHIIFAAEASSGWVLFADTIKRMTGGDNLNARQLYRGDFLEAQPMFTPWVMTNEYPMIKNVDQALWQRMISIPFNNSTPAHERKATFVEELVRSSQEAILAWLVEGWNIYRSPGFDIVQYPNEIAVSTADMRGQLSEIDMFLSEQCKFGPDETCHRGDLYARYREWMTTNGDERDALSGNKFAREMTNRGFGFGREGRNAHLRTGLSLRSFRGASPS